MYNNYANLLNHTFINVLRAGDEIHLTRQDGETFTFRHFQECCESVWLEEVIGDLNDLIGSPLLVAESRSSVNGDSVSPPERLKEWEYEDCWAWTFIELATNKGSVTLRWFGSSNGYYSVGVDLISGNSRYYCN
jgi:hypothetical protein